MTSYPSVLTRAPSPGRAITRDRLVDLVLQGDAQCVLLLAPAGSGKTMLAAQAAGAWGARVIWVRLAPGYEGAADLVGIARATSGREIATEGASLLQLAADLLELLEDEPTLLVVDDYHAGAGEECDPLVGEIVALSPPGSRIIL